MTAFFASIDDNQRLVITCALTTLAGLFLGAAWAVWSLRHHRPVTDDEIDEYRDAADEVFDQETDTPIYEDLAFAALRRDLDEWGRS